MQKESIEHIYNPIPEDLFIRYSDKLEGQSFYHTHNGYELYFLVDGIVNYYIDQQCYRLDTKTIIVMRPGEYHRVEMLDNKIYKRFVINISSRYLEMHSTSHTNLRDCFNKRFNNKPPIVVLDNETAEELLTLYNSLMNIKKSADYGQDVATSSYVLLLLVKINLLFYNSKDSTAMPNVMPVLVNKTRSYIDAHLLETITLEELSDKLFYNGTYISRKFKAATGLSIQQYILRKRIYLAQNYLDEGKSVTESCMLSGFSDYSNFSKMFKKCIGISPKQYQQKVLNNSQPYMV